ncbi:uncharacterized protein LOC105217753 isoform X2 [Zeugodacus cucurbitae]|uniref:uncharacterized protein LOC105217753 isoform X2 n=1 Tax=Zeugodacus cucurbitae TaxID=28588 RepID=UPI0010A7456E|nr:uncharacterized protein LOC105217753 isoform X2 [Zeugodacus cucurbitae]
MDKIRLSWISTLTVSISYPIIDLSLHRTVLFDWGFQMNYDFPFSPTSFYNAPIWKLEKRDVHNNNDTRSFDKANFNDFEAMEYVGAFKNWLVPSKDKHFFDFTAGELYNALENVIASYGFHSSCLLQSVCDIAKYPFDAEERHLIRDLLTFILTPSLHSGFAASEDVQRKAYETAEWSGMRGLNCRRLYPACRRNFLRIISKVIFDNT